jgi:hypothetical protein
LLSSIQHRLVNLQGRTLLTWRWQRLGPAVFFESPRTWRSWLSWSKTPVFDGPDCIRVTGLDGTTEIGVITRAARKPHYAHEWVLDAEGTMIGALSHDPGRGGFCFPVLNEKGGVVTRITRTGRSNCIIELGDKTPRLLRRLAVPPPLSPN